jgi:nucleoside-diphosphate-sugar epimerase
LPSRLLRAALLGDECRDLNDVGETTFSNGGYDQIYVKDAARAIVMLALAPKLAHAAYNVGGGRLPLYDEFVAAIRHAVPECEIELPVRPASTPPGAMDGRWMTIDRIRQELGFMPEYDPQSAIADYAAWLRSEGINEERPVKI